MSVCSVGAPIAGSAHSRNQWPGDELVRLRNRDGCEICGGNERELVAKRPDLFLGGSVSYAMYRCVTCGVLYQYPRPSPDAISVYYPVAYPQYTDSIHHENLIRRVDRRFGLKKRCRIVTAHVEGGRLLDVGCATGDFADEMKRVSGWRVFGVEPTASAATRARNENGIDVVRSAANWLPFAPNSMSAITMWDVLEHVHDPRRVIAECARVLRPGGAVVVNHPNLDSFDRRFFAHLWIGYELPRHLYLFSAGLLRSLMAEHGLIEVERRCLYGSQAANSTSLGFVATAALGPGRAAKVARRLFLSWPWRIATLPYFKLVDWLGRGSNITALFRKS